ncbi:PIN domain-containing protein [Paenibacillus taichungensis]
MKSLFPGHHYLTEDQFAKLWKESTFVFDTNILLKLYKYPRQLRETTLEIMEALKGRIWIPYQVAMEFHLHFRDQIYNQNDAYTNLKKTLSNNIDSIIKELENLSHSNIDVDPMIQTLNHSKNVIVDELENQESKQPDLNELTERISSIIGQNVGRPYEEKRLLEIYGDGESRYKDKIPPGYMDAKVKSDQVTIHDGLKYQNKYGDLVYWRQMLDHSKNEEVKSVILISDDTKEDWVLKVKGEKKGPHPELIYEFYRESSGKQFHLYNSKQFLKYANKYLFKKDSVDTGIDVAIKEIEALETFEQENNLQSTSRIERKAIKMPDFRILTWLITVNEKLSNEELENFYNVIDEYFMDTFGVGVEYRLQLKFNRPVRSSYIFKFPIPRDMVLSYDSLIADVENTLNYYFPSQNIEIRNLTEG